jgi:adenine-specific DNA-methyltransferase
MSDQQAPGSVRDLVRASVALGAEHVTGWSPVESALAERHVGSRPLPKVDDLRERILDGEDPLGEAFGMIRSAEERRPLGQTYTPPEIVSAMIDWTAEQGRPARVVDPGSGSGRYVLAAARRFTRAQLVASDIDPVATLMTRAALAVVGAADRSRVVLGDYRDLALDRVRGVTAFVGNPPYVRHHQIDGQRKEWLLQAARARGLSASGLAGLHVHFFLATAEHGSSGDVGAFITSAEWLDVNYGSLVRELLLDGLGGQSLHVLEPQVAPFPDAATTGAITTFVLGSRPTSIRLKRVKDIATLGPLGGGRPVARQRLAAAHRWSVLTRVTPKMADGEIELGELCRVHRGTVTGANNIWVTARDATNLPERFLFAAVTKARELFAAGERLDLADALRVVIDLPVDLDVLEASERRAVDAFLRRAKKQGVHEGYIASNRRAWWRVGLRAPAPILGTYMARRPPAFVRNHAEARHINIAHGLYPREPLEAAVLDRLAAHLRTAVTQAQGRTYAGGLTKFEPREMERLTVPSLERLRA